MTDLSKALVLYSPPKKFIESSSTSKSDQENQRPLSHLEVISANKGTCRKSHRQCHRREITSRSCCNNHFPVSVSGYTLNYEPFSIRLFYGSSSLHFEMDPNHNHSNFGIFSNGQNQHSNYQPVFGSQPQNQNFPNLGTNQDFGQLRQVGPGAGQPGQSNFQQGTAADQTQGYHHYHNGTAINFFVNAGGYINLGSLPGATNLANNPPFDLQQQQQNSSQNCSHQSQTPIFSNGIVPVPTRNYSNPNNRFNESAYGSNQYRQGQTSQQQYGYQLPPSHQYGYQPPPPQQYGYQAQMTPINPYQPAVPTAGAFQPLPPNGSQQSGLPTMNSFQQRAAQSAGDYFYPATPTSSSDTSIAGDDLAFLSQGSCSCK